MSLRGEEKRADFCARLGIVDGTYSNYERGKRVPDSTFLAMLRERLGVDLNWLCTGEGTAYAVPSPTERQAVAVAEATLDRMDEAFRIEPAWPLPAVRRAALAGTREELVRFAVDAGLPGTVRARADTMLIAAFQDEGATSRMQERERQRGYERAADNLRVDEVIAAAGWDPGDDARLALYQLAALHGASTESLVFLLETLAGRFRRPPP